jgi:streptogramin lyase
MKIRSLKMQDQQYGNQWCDEVKDRWDYQDFQDRPEWRNGWISMDCGLNVESQKRIYLGVTSFASDIFHAYDRESGRFVNLGFNRIADPFDAKFHRALVQAPDGMVYAGIALLHDVDLYWDAPGGAIVRYNPLTNELVKLAIPIPHCYIQSIVLDPERQIIYCLHFAPEYLSSYNLRTGEVKNLGLVGSGYGGMAHGENIVLDDNGCVWCNWSLTRAWQSEPGSDAIRLCKYDPESGKIIFYRTGLPRTDGTHGFVKTESFFNFHDGSVYASGDGGSFYRIDPKSGSAEFLFKPIQDRPSRLSSLVEREPGLVYGVTGRNGNCQFMRINLKAGTFEILGNLVDSEGEALWQAHDVVVTKDGTFYVCENDNPHRSSYLWEVKI